MKIKQFQNLLRKKKIDAAVFINTGLEKRDLNIMYFSGVDFEYGCLIVPKKGSSVLMVPQMEYARIKEHSTIKNVLKIRKNMFREMKKVLRNPKVIGLNMSIFSLAEYRNTRKIFRAKFVDVRELCSELREIKTNEEVRRIKAACRITDEIFKKLLRRFKEFRTEGDVLAFIEYETKKAGCDTAFKPIVASGRNSAHPHHETERHMLKPGFCILDFGVKYKGYRSDITRTVYIGRPGKKDIENYNLVLDVQQEAIKSIKAGMKCSLVHNMVSDRIGSKYFLHALGHGIGISVHERPSISQKSIDKFKPGMVFAIEPGMYKRQGIRIEDDLLMTGKGTQVLTKSPKDLIILH